MKIITATCTVAVLLASVTAVRAEQSGGWDIAVSKTGQVASMTDEAPATDLRIEKALVLNIGRVGEIVSGTVYFKNGLHRAMGKQEAASYFETLNGPHALWSYWQKHNMLRVLKTGRTIPHDWYGKHTRMLTLSGSDVVGTLTAAGTGGAAHQASIVVENSSAGPIFFTMNAVRQLQQLR